MTIELHLLIPLSPPLLIHIVAMLKKATRLELRLLWLKSVLPDVLPVGAELPGSYWQLVLPKALELVLREFRVITLHVPLLVVVHGHCALLAADQFWQFLSLPFRDLLLHFQSFGHNKKT